MRLVLNGKAVRPDIVFTRARVAIFLDGCWWHSCPLHGMQPKQNAAYWREKFDETRARDTLADTLLLGADWIVIRVWEHENPLEAAERIQAVVKVRADLAL